MDSCEEVGEGNALCETGSHLLLGIDGTDVADLRRILASKREVTYFIQGDFKSIGNHLNEPTAAGCTLIIHHEIDDLTRRIDLYPLDILTADIDDRPGLGEELYDPLCMAGDLRELFVGKRDVNSSVACSDNEGDFLNSEGGSFQGLFHHSVGQPALLRTRGTDNRSDDPFVQDHRLRHR